MNADLNVAVIGKMRKTRRVELYLRFALSVFFTKYRQIALKEANETGYWLKLLFETGRINEVEYQSTEKLCGNIRRLLIAFCSTAKNNIKNKNHYEA